MSSELGELSNSVLKRPVVQLTQPVFHSMNVSLVGSAPRYNEYTFRIKSF